MSGRPSWKSAGSAFFALFGRVRRPPGKSRKRPFCLRYPQICLNPHLLNPHFQGCENGVFGKWCFCPLPKTGGFDEKWRKSRFTFHPQKQAVLLLRPRKPTKMTKMGGVTQAKPPFAKNTVFATLTFAAPQIYAQSSYGMFSALSFEVVSHCQNLGSG